MKTIRQAEIWYVNLDPTIGQEINKLSTCIVVSDNIVGKLMLKTVVPVTGWKDIFKEVPWMTKLIPTEENGLDKISSADAFQIRSVSVNRFYNRVGHVDSKTLLNIHSAIVKTLSLRYSIAKN